MSGPVAVKHVPKPWGHETIWALTDRYCGKVLHINAGHALSVQYHNKKDETVHLLSGRLVYWVKVDGELRGHAARGRTVLPHNARHRALHGSGHRLRRSRGRARRSSTTWFGSDRYGREGTSAP